MEETQKLYFAADALHHMAGGGRCVAGTINLWRSSPESIVRAIFDEDLAVVPDVNARDSALDAAAGVARALRDRVALWYITAAGAQNWTQVPDDEPPMTTILCAIHQMRAYKTLGGPVREYRVPA